MSDEINELEAVPWDDVLRQLRLHAERRMRRYIWQGRRGAPLPEGMNAEDVVHDVVMKFFRGDRKWNRQRYKSIVEFLRAAVDSELEHHATSWANKHLRAEAVLSDGDRRRLAAVPAGDDAAQEVLDAQIEQEAHGVVTAFLLSLEDEPDLHAMLVCILDGVFIRRELVKTLGITDLELHNRRRRLQRRWTQFQTPKRRRAKR